jgi:YggT family protein
VGAVLAIASLVLLVMLLLLLARAVLSWIVTLAGPSAAGSVRYRLSAVVHALTEPVLSPVRRALPPVRLGGISIDLAFVVVFVAIVVLRGLIG